MARRIFLLGFLLWLTACRAAAPAPAPTPLPTVTAPPPTAVPTATLARPTRAPTPVPPPTAQYGASGLHRVEWFLPATVPPTRPTVLIFHGSGVSAVDYRGLARHLAAQGSAVVSANYQARTMAEDAQCALAWVQAHAAELGFAAEIVVFGHSRGGVPSAYLGLVDDAAPFAGNCPQPPPELDAVRGVMTFGGVFASPLGCADEPACVRSLAALFNRDAELVTTVLNRFEATAPSEWGALAWSDAEREVAQRFPLLWLDGQDPPWLIVHRREDVVVSAETAVQFADHLSQFLPSGKVELVLLDGTGHNDPMSEQTPGFAELTPILDAFLAAQRDN